MTIDATSGLILQAVIRQDISAWDRWRDAGGAFDSLATRKLYGLVYALLRERGRTADPHFAAAREAYRQTWRRTEILLLRACQVSDRLASEGIETLLLKGGAVVDRFYGDRGLRPMNDFDLLLKEEDIARAVSILGKLQWTSMTRVPVEWMPRHDFTLRHANGGECDLHRRLFPGAPETLTVKLFADASQVKLQSFRVEIPSEADILFHAIVHGWMMQDSDLLTMVDAARVVIDGRIDWKSFLDRALGFRIARAAHAALLDVSTVSGMAIPPDVLEALTAAPFRDRRIVGSHRAAQFAGMVRRGGFHGAIAFLHLLEEDWSIEPRRVPLEIARRWMRRGSRPQHH